MMGGRDCDNNFVIYFQVNVKVIINVTAETLFYLYNVSYSAFKSFFHQAPHLLYYVITIKSLNHGTITAM